jgi:Xaa-Pro dipeptidase
LADILLANFVNVCIRFLKILIVSSWLLALLTIRLNPRLSRLKAQFQRTSQHPGWPALVDSITRYKMNKRDFLKLSGAAGLAAVSRPVFAANGPTLDDLVDMTGDAVPISVGERLARVEKAQRLMRQAGIDALLLEAGSALIYFTGVRWWRSERFTGAIIPAEGDIAFVTPYFEEPSVRESMTFGDDVRTWHEHESPFDLVAGILADRGLKSGKVGVEETVRHFIVDGVQKAAPAFDVVSGKDIARGCRMYKSPAEIALMQTANDVTIAAYHHVHKNIDKDMLPSDISTLMNDATRALGGQPQFAGVLLNEASAYPHGTGQTQHLKEGGVILMDCGCAVHSVSPPESREMSGIQSSVARRWRWRLRQSVRRRAKWTTSFVLSTRARVMGLITQRRACHTALGTESVWTEWTDTSRSTSSAAKRRRSRRECVSPTSPGSTSLASSA